MVSNLIAMTADLAPLLRVADVLELAHDHGVLRDDQVPAGVQGPEDRGLEGLALDRAVRVERRDDPHLDRGALGQRDVGRRGG